MGATIDYGLGFRVGFRGPPIEYVTWGSTGCYVGTLGPWVIGLFGKKTDVGFISRAGDLPSNV